MTAGKTVAEIAISMVVLRITGAAFSLLHPAFQTHRMTSGVSTMNSGESISSSTYVRQYPDMHPFWAGLSGTNALSTAFLDRLGGAIGD
jgi:hypothetical protein